MAASDKKVPGNYHALYEPAVRALRPRAPGAAEAAPDRRWSGSRMSVKDLAVDVDAATQMPVSIRSRAAGTRLSAGRGVSRGGDQGIRQEPRRPLEPGRRRRRHAGSPLGQPPGPADGPAGPADRRGRGLPGGTQGALDADNQLVSVTGQVFSGAGAASGRQAVARRARATTTTPESAIAKAATDLTGVEYAAKDFKAAGEAERRATPIAITSSSPGSRTSGPGSSALSASRT